MTEDELRAFEERCQARGPAILQIGRYHHAVPILCAEIRRLQTALAEASKPTVVHVRDEMVKQPSLLSTDVEGNK